MEGCSVLLFLGIAIGALLVAVNALSRAKAAQSRLDALHDEVTALWGIVRDLRRAERMPAASADAAPPTVQPASTGMAKETAATPSAWQPHAEPLIEPAPQPATIHPAAPPSALAPELQPAAFDASSGQTSPPEPPPPPAEPPFIPPYVPPPPGKPFDWENLVGIKLFSWIAGVALVLAAVFFLKYSVEHGWLSPPIRATFGVITGVALLVICEMRVARGYTFTANAMHGAGIAILYATLFAVHALWHLLAAPIVFLLMLIVTAVAVGLSIRRDSMFIALLGLMGGFATPALLSTGENRPVGLFSYLLLLNLGLAWVAYKKRWPALTLGSAIFTVMYQWGWVAKYLTPAQLPLAVAIFAIFAAAGATALWLSRRDADESGQGLFDRVAVAAAAMPVAFAVFTAAVPAYGARYHTLFGFLLLVASGLALIAVVRGQPWLHAIGGGAVLLTFIVWTSRSYTASAWPAVLAWLTAFVLLYLLVAAHVATPANFTAPLLFFVLPALIAIEPRTASPLVLFATFFALLGITAYVAVRYARGPLYFAASFFIIIGQAMWSARYLTPDRLYSALLLYGAFGLLFLGVPLFARRTGRALTPAVGAPITTLLSLAMLLFLTIDSVAGAALWGLTLLLAILLIGTIVESKFTRSPVLAMIGIALMWIVLGSWWEALDLQRSVIAPLFTVAAFGIVALLGTIWASRDEEGTMFAQASHLALSGHLFLLFIAGSGSLAFPPWPLFAVLAILTLAVGTASLYLRRGTLAIGGAVAGQLVLLTWSTHSLLRHWANVALAATLLMALWAVVWSFLSERVVQDDEERAKFRFAAYAALMLGHGVAMIANRSADAPLFETLLATHVLLAIVTLLLAWRADAHTLALWSVALMTIATLTSRTATPLRTFTFAVFPYAIYIANPLLLARRAKESLHPYLAAVIASAAFFFFARDAMNDAGLGYMIGALPIAQALILLVLVLRLVQIEAPDQRVLGRLAIVAGAALAFITVAVPLQLDKQWITIAWALEGAALVWLFTRIPHRGLIAWASALLAIAFVRLTFNPAILGYYPSSSRPIINWYLYTYLVSAAACFAATYWLPSEWKQLRAAASTLGTILLFLLLNIEIADFYSTGPTLTFQLLSSSLAQDLTYTMGWAVFALGMLTGGIVLRVRAARVAALVLLLTTILKCFLHDLAQLTGLYRVGSLLALALSLVAVGVLLQKYVIARQAPVAPAEETPT
jgi:uncharacterized membrane protein